MHLSLLESCSLIIMLCHLWKDKLPCPPIVGIHRRRPCRWLIIGCHHWVDIPCLSHKPLVRWQWIRRCIRHLECWHLEVPCNRPCSSSSSILRILSHRRNWRYRCHRSFPCRVSHLRCSRTICKKFRRHTISPPIGRILAILECRS